MNNSLGGWLGKWVSEKCEASYEQEKQGQEKEEDCKTDGDKTGEDGGKNGRLEDPQFFDHQKTQDEINQIFQQGDPFIVVWVNSSS